MAIQFINIFDLKTLLVTSLAGSYVIFTFLALIFISGLAGMFRMPSEVYLMSLMLFLVLMSQYVGGLFLIGLLIAGIVTFMSISRLFTQ